MTYQEAEKLCYADLCALRLRASELTVKLGQPDNSQWIGTASRKQLLAEIIRLFSNNHREEPF
jgi:hypothetical protein